MPSGNQLQTLEDQAYIYVGNPGLCGPLLLRKCAEQVEDPTYVAVTGDHDGGVTDVTSFLLAMGSGLVAGLWVVFCIFLFKKKWRVSWLSLCDSMYDRIYVLVAVTWASLTRKSG